MDKEKIINDDDDSAYMLVRAFVLTSSGKCEEVKYHCDLPDVDLKICYLRPEIESLPDPQATPSRLTIGGVNIVNARVAGMIEQHQAQAVRFMEPAHLVIIAFEAGALYRELAEQLEQLSNILGINTLLFPLSGQTPVALTPLRGSFSACLMATSGDPSVAWLQVFDGLMRSAWLEGLVCVDWEEIREFFDLARHFFYHQIEFPTTLQAIETAILWIKSISQDKKPTNLMVMFRQDSSLRMSTINRVTSVAREHLDEEARLLFMTPEGDLPAVTLIWSC